MSAEDEKPLTEAELQIRRLLNLKKKSEEKIKTDADEPGVFDFPTAASVTPAKPVKRTAKKKQKNMIKLDSKTYNKLSETVKKLNERLADTKVSKDRLASLLVERFLAVENLISGADTKEKLEEIIKALEIKAGGNG